MDVQVSGSLAEAELTLHEYNLMVTCFEASNRQRRQLSVRSQLRDTAHCSVAVAASCDLPSCLSSPPRFVPG